MFMRSRRILPFVTSAMEMLNSPFVRPNRGYKRQMSDLQQYDANAAQIFRRYAKPQWAKEDQRNQVLGISMLALRTNVCYLVERGCGRQSRDWSTRTHHSTVELANLQLRQS